LRNNQLREFDREVGSVRRSRARHHPVPRQYHRAEHPSLNLIRKSASEQVYQKSITVSTFRS
jgi:hypothetical protein